MTKTQMKRWMQKQPPQLAQLAVIDTEQEFSTRVFLVELHEQQDPKQLVRLVQLQTMTFFLLHCHLLLEHPLRAIKGLSHQVHLVQHLTTKKKRQRLCLLHYA
jgi:hypothetical protein